MIDRPIRPLFAEGFRNEVQVVNTILSVDQDASAEMAAMLGASLALCISDIPFNGPIAGVKVGRIDGELIVNPSAEQSEKSDIDLTVAGTKYALNMVEAGAKEVSEQEMLDALMFGFENVKSYASSKKRSLRRSGNQNAIFLFSNSTPMWKRSARKFRTGDSRSGIDRKEARTLRKNRRDHSPSRFVV